MNMYFKFAAISALLTIVLTSDDGMRNKRKIDSDGTMLWTHSENMDDEGNYILRWYARDEEIFFRVEARTKGYVGLGFSPNGGMKGADVALAWVDDITGHAVVWDCHTIGDGNSQSLERDVVEHYRVSRGVQNDTHTIVEFARQLDTCDPSDYALTTDTTRVIWAIHDSDPQLETPFMYHGNKHRGTKSIHLLSPTPVPQHHHSHVRKWDVSLNNFVVPDNTDTMYWCKIFKPPTLQSKYHIIGYEPNINTIHKGLAHHIILYECEIGSHVQTNIWEKYTHTAGAACYGPFMPEDWKVCLTPVVAWAVGSKGEFFPKHVGLPLSANNRSYYMLEIHFDNPSMKRLVGSWGLDLYYTRELRRHDAGILVAGVTVSPLHVIPPHQPEYRTAGLCSGECTKTMFPENGINIVSVLLHSHLAGKKLSLRHVRNAEELPRIVEDNHYDFDYQQSHMLKEERVVFPGDTLITECIYQTKDRSRPTVGGYSTKQEMCLAFAMYYPRINLAGCYSMVPVQQFFKIFGVKEFYNNDMKNIEKAFMATGSEPTFITSKPTLPTTTFPKYAPGEEFSYEANQRAIKALQQAKDYTIEGDTSAIDGPFEQLVIKEPLEFRNKTFMSHLNEIPWEESLLTKRIEESFYKGPHLTFCKRRDDTLAMRSSVQNFPSFIEHTDNTTRKQCASMMFQSSSDSIKLSIYSLVLFKFQLFINFYL